MTGVAGGGEQPGWRAWLRSARDHIAGEGHKLTRRWREGGHRRNFDFPGPGRLVTARDVLVVVYMALTTLLVALLFDEEAARAARQFPMYVYSIFATITRVGDSAWILILTGVGTLAALSWAASLGHLIERRALEVLAGRSAFIFASVALSGILSQIIKRVGRARPKLLDNGGPFQFDFLSFKSTWASFASGHAITSFALATALAVLFPRWRVPLFAAAALVACSRVIIGSHYPSDVVAGATIGVAVVVLMHRSLAARDMIFSSRSGMAKTRGDMLLRRGLTRLYRRWRA